MNEVPICNSYQEMSCIDAENFWSLLSPQNSLKKAPSKFIYRGQRDSSWELLPSILRQDTKNTARRVWGKKDITCDEQVFTELSTLQHFVEQCDLQGLSIPNDSREFREKHLNTQTANFYFKSPNNWPNTSLFEIMGLAQHHGIETRLLDWTKRSYVAAYFAAASALEIRNNRNEDKKMVVWALDIECIHLFQNISIIKVPGSTSKNLAAQAGVFTLHRHTGGRGQIFNPVPLESEFNKCPEIQLFKITVPVNAAKDILMFCEQYGVTASTLFPGYDGAARAVRDLNNRWDRSAFDNITE
jgi:hypothetical protein